MDEYDWMMPDPDISAQPEPNVVMLFLNGRSNPSFRCGCGANCFAEFAPLHFRCNGCSATYRGSP